MDNVLMHESGAIGRNFIPGDYLPAGRDEYYLRCRQNPRPADTWRHLRVDERELLVKNRNTADNWDDIRVTDDFDPALIRNSEFFGLVRIGRLRNGVLEHDDLQLPAGIRNSVIVACDIGDDAAIHDVRYLAHFIIGDRCLLANIDEMLTTNHAKFGNGILKDGEPDGARLWLDLMNEAGGRRVLPFDGMIPADAYLWAKYRDDETLLARLRQMTQERFDSRRGYYGTVGDQCVIKSTRLLKDVRVGAHCTIEGANKIENLTIRSSGEEPSRIGEGVELVDGIVGYGCRVSYGCKAVRFILGDNCRLRYGARLIHSVLGDNSAVSCCEVLNNLIFPAHEQHHNNSFLIASVVLGQSNVAAGATIGSNHNSRANDNEIQAGRGFWPGLCTSVKHSCRFASFVLLAKGDYPAELDVPLPFSLLNNNAALDRLEVMPAYWWLCNMYALARNSRKFQDRDKRIHKAQNIEFDPLAPDSVEEILCAQRLLERWTGRAGAKRAGRNPADLADEELVNVGRKFLTGPSQALRDLEILGEGMENSSRKVLILKAAGAYRAYGQMLLYYAVKNLIDYLSAHDEADFDAMQNALKGTRRQNWVNLGGQLMPAEDVDRLRADVAAGRLARWEDVHRRYDELWGEYPRQKQRHALAVLAELHGGSLSREQWLEALTRAVQIQEHIRDQVYLSRKKDDDNPFRQATFRHAEEMAAAVGCVDDNEFVKQVRRETEQFRQRAAAVSQRG